MNDLDPRLIVFIREELLDPCIIINPNSCIEGDFGVSGDDADEFIYAFSMNFNVDISEFDISKYFYSEPSCFSFEKGKLILTVAMLNQAIEDHKLK